MEELEQNNNHPLNKSDIQSLGFKVTCNHHQRTLSKVCYGKILHLGKDVEFLIDSDMWCQIIIHEDGIEDYLFQGTIKNKSELKVLLNQLGIN